MKRFKPFTKFSLSLLLIGSFLASIGFFAGGWTDIEKIAHNNYQETTVELDTFSRLEVGFPIEIKVTDTKKPRLTYLKNTNHQVTGVSYRMYENTLRIEEEAGGSFFNSSTLLKLVFDFINKGKTKHTALFLEVPKNTQLTSADIWIDYGGISLTGLSIKELSLTAEAGDISLTDISSQKSDINNQLGDIYIQSSKLREAHIRLEAGDLIADQLSLTGDSLISNALGDVQLKLTSDTAKELLITAYTELGDIAIPKNKLEYSDHTLDIYNEAGDISIE